jgi:hypothetical protein
LDIGAAAAAAAEEEKEEEEEEDVRQNSHINWLGIESHPPQLFTRNSPSKPGLDLRTSQCKIFIATCFSQNTLQHSALSIFPPSAPYSFCIHLLSLLRKLINRNAVKQNSPLQYMKPVLCSIRACRPMLGSRLLLAVPVAILVFHTACRSCGGVNDKLTLSRRKRFIVFPEGSTFSVSLNVLCSK